MSNIFHNQPRAGAALTGGPAWGLGSRDCLAAVYNWPHRVRIPRNSGGFADAKRPIQAQSAAAGARCLRIAAADARPRDRQMLLLAALASGCSSCVAPQRAGSSRWSYHPLSDPGAVCLDGSPGAFDYLPALSPPLPPAPGREPPPPRCQLARVPDASHRSYSYFIKTGGNPAVTFGFESANDKCCRQSEKDCRWFISASNATALAACTKALETQSCLPCPPQPNVTDKLGCPSWASPAAPGYRGANTSWQIHLAGGGWCYNASDCAARATSYLGSSKLFNRSHVPSGGPLSPDPAANPHFFAWHRVQIRYCDGFSFTGHREQPVLVTLPDGKSRTLHVRGRAILLAALQALLPLGLANAQQVMLTGDSAGGLAVFHAADTVGAFLKLHAPNLQTYKAVPVSGFFLDHEDVDGEPQYANALRNAFAFQNASVQS